MGNKLFKGILIGALMLTGCASNPSADNVLRERYIHLKSVANPDNIGDIAHDYYSHELLGENFIPEPDEIWQLMLWKDLPVEIAYYESISGSIGCITVLGYAKDGEPAALKYRYAKSPMGWMIDLQEIAYLESEKNYPQKAECPTW